MPKSIGYATLAAGETPQPYQFERRELRANDVAIDILFCGVCHTDIHFIHNDFGMSQYPLVPGHEIVGRVTDVGSEVVEHKVGDLVGVGCMVDSCQHCSPCHDGLEQFCDVGEVQTYNSNDYHDGSVTMGGYANNIVVRNKFVLKIPDRLAIEAAAPLLCAGISVYSPLRHFGIGKGHKVAVVGMGGLGHMGIRLAKAMGASVTLFTRSADKADEARRHGVENVVITSDPAQMEAALGQFDLVLDTIPVKHDLNPYLETLRHSGALVIIGMIDFIEPPVHTVSLLSKRRILTSSKIGGIRETQEMLDFCAEHGVQCDVELIEIQKLDEAFERMLKGDVRYRFVIDMASLKSNELSAQPD